MDEPASLAQRVIDAFGKNVSEAAAALGIPYTTVDTWRRAGRIPDLRHDTIRAAAQRLGKTLPTDFPAATASKAA